MKKVYACYYKISKLMNLDIDKRKSEQFERKMKKPQDLFLQKL